MAEQQLSIEQALNWAKQHLKQQGISDDGLHSSAVIDSKVLLCDSLDCASVYLHTWPEKLLSENQLQHFKQAVAKRALGHPVAHILGYREFWSLKLQVSPATLIPRPETELLVDVALATALSANINEQARVLDLGTGTGAIALALATEKNNWTVLGVDKSPEAIELAKSNGQTHHLEHVSFLQSDWFSALDSQKYDLIVTNPPYIEQQNSYLNLGDVRFEPASALTSGADGLDDIRLIASQAKAYLKSGGWLMIEHGYQQASSVADILSLNGFTAIHTEHDLNDLPRVTIGCISM